MASSKTTLSALITPELLGVMDNLPFPISFAELSEDPPRVVFINKAFKRVFGYRLEEISDINTWAERAYPDAAYRHEVMGSWSRDAEIAFQNSDSIPIREVEICARDGTTVRTLLNGTFVGTSVVVAFIDISQQTRAEAELRDVRQYLERTAYELTENLPVGTYTMVLPPGGGLGQFRFLSPRFLEITGLTREAVQADPLLAFTCIHPEDYDRWLELNQVAFANVEPFYGEARLSTHQDERWIAAESKPRPLADGSIVWEGVIMDITDRKRAEESLKRAKVRAEAAERVKSDFLTRMSHEIRTPLTMMLGLTELLADDCQNPTQTEKVTQLQNAGNLLLGIVNDILDLSKIEAGQLITEELPFELSDLYASVRAFEASITKPNLTLVLEHPRTAQPTLVGDQRRIEQILSNLIGNAIKFTERGQITVTFRLTKRNANSARLRVSVQDTGKGIEQSQVAELFKPFTQASTGIAREYGGTGLGLSISKELVELMGGSIDARTEPNKGSTFWFELPLVLLADHARPSKGSAASSLTPTTLPIDPLKGIRVLVVDDSMSIRGLIREFLRRAGAEVEVIENGALAIEVLEARSSQFDCVMMDVQMPVMDGLTATARIRQNPALDHIPVLAMTAGLLAEQQARARQAGMADVVAKPVTPTRMVEQILKAIGKSESSQPASNLQHNPMPAIAGIDRGHANRTMGGSLEMFDLLVDVFVQEFDGFEDQINASLASGLKLQQVSNAKRLTHSLRGSATQLGASDLAQAAAALERTLDTHAARYGVQLKPLARRLNDLIESIKQYQAQRR
jgi:PAS domain S-box-containing protein